ncbi:energy-coupling factor transporter transmembrane component T family protein [Limosilactobacillus difficilis]|uniref:energy-coupling factor transporter transmembrane component T family protein n=1 Tax=Limosilactobacillus difficilis TaxID=2991838 RepID=UPI0024BB5DC3|nr:energy-coupling factor transporter transmembrane component T [Limosilactobacillus difficilis]
MNNSVVFGSYVPLDSPIHRLDPRAKLMICFWYVILVFFANGLWTNLWLAFFLLILLLLTRVPFVSYWRGVKPMLWIILFTIAVQILFSSGGHVYWHWGWIAITSGGVRQCGLIFARFMLIIISSTVLTATTPPLQLADAVASVMQPLKYLHVPVNSIALMLSIALRFIPTIVNEVQQIMNAQRARGANFDTGSIFSRAKRLIPVLIPLFVSSFKRAEDLATAMDARGYDPDASRSKYRVLQWQWPDTVAAIAMSACTIVLVLIRIGL